MLYHLIKNYLAQLVSLIIFAHPEEETLLIRREKVNRTAVVYACSRKTFEAIVEKRLYDPIKFIQGVKNYCCKCYDKNNIKEDFTVTNLLNNDNQ